MVEVSDLMVLKNQMMRLIKTALKQDEVNTVPKKYVVQVGK